MTTDKEWFDFMLGTTGWQTGSSWNQAGLDVHNRSQRGYEPQRFDRSYTPAPKVYPSGGSSPTSSAPASAPKVRPAIRPINAQRIQLKAPAIHRIRGKVASYLYADGRIKEDDNGDLGKLFLVPKQKHLDALRAAYMNYWKGEYDWLMAKSSVSEEQYRHLTDTKERLKDAEYGKYHCMLSREGGTVTLSTYDRKKKLFGGLKYKKKRPRKVSSREYDRMFRIFVAEVFGKNSKFRFTFGEKKLVDSPMSDVLEFYISSPSVFGHD